MSKRFSISSRIPCKAKQELLYISVAVKCYFMHMIDTFFSHRNISFATFHLLQALVLKLAQRGFTAAASAFAAESDPSPSNTSPRSVDDDLVLVFVSVLFRRLEHETTTSD